MFPDPFSTLLILSSVQFDLLVNLAIEFLLSMMKIFIFRCSICGFFFSKSVKFPFFQCLSIFLGII